MLGALRDEVVPEVLGGRPAEDAVAAEPATRSRPTRPTPSRSRRRGRSVPAPAEPAPAVDDTGEVTAPAPAAALVPDEACAAAVDLAREAAAVEAGDAVGDHLGVEAEDALTVTHSFATTDPAYVGWRWAVTVTRADGTDSVTVDEVVLLPGTGALLAPAWVPYSERVEPGDLGAADLLPPAPDDVRLVPAYADPEAELAAEVFWELGLGRPRVLSLDGRADAAERWHEGDTGPRSPRALAAPGNCVDCGFLVPLGGALRQGFGVCANAQAPDDGRVVALGHGCGAHSETPLELTHTATSELVVDDVEFAFEDRGPVEQADVEQADVEQADVEQADVEQADVEQAEAAVPDPLPGPADEQQAEELGHS